MYAMGILLSENSSFDLLLMGESNGGCYGLSRVGDLKKNNYYGKLMRAKYRPFLLLLTYLYVHGCVIWY